MCSPHWSSVPLKSLYCSLTRDHIMEGTITWNISFFSDYQMWNFYAIKPKHPQYMVIFLPALWQDLHMSPNVSLPPPKCPLITRIHGKQGIPVVTYTGCDQALPQLQENWFWSHYRCKMAASSPWGHSEKVEQQNSSVNKDVFRKKIPSSFRTESNIFPLSNATNQQISQTCIDNTDPWASSLFNGSKFSQS